MNGARKSLLLFTAVFVVSGARVSTGFSTPEPVGEERLYDDMLKVAAEYKEWGRVDDEVRWAPWLCRNPNPGRAAFSKSSDDQTHGSKLYSLFAMHRDAYVDQAESKRVQIGQVLVKQSWIPEEITNADDKPTKGIDRRKVIRTPNPASAKEVDRFHLDDDNFYPYAWRGDKVFKATKQADLFIMMKLDPKTPGTDAGWVYATVTPDGKKVTAAGKIESCMKCHLQAKNDRLFGLR